MLCVLQNAIPTLEGAYKQLIDSTKVVQDLDRTRLHILEVIGIQLKMKDISSQPGAHLVLDLASRSKKN